MRRNLGATFFYLLFMGMCFTRVNAALPSASPVEIKKHTLKYMKNGADSKVPYFSINKKPYFSVELLARLSQAQLRWQAVTQQVCLSNINGLLCLNWDLSRAERDGRITKRKLPLHFENNRLYVPISYVTSKEFQTFSNSDFKWIPAKNKFIQTAAVQLGNPRVERLSDRYQIRVETPEKGSQYLIEQNQKRIWIRFVRANTNGTQIFEGDDVVREIKIVQRRRSADMIISLGERAGDNDVYFDDRKKNLFIDVFTTAQIANSSLGKNKRKKKYSKTSKRSGVPVRKARSRNKAKSVRKGMRTIVIDAGHGGVDAGAIGPRGTLEKNINLTVARALEKLLKREKNVRVVMTRGSDVFIPLSERTNIANAAQADIFISIHCNSSLSSKSLGFETYFLSPDATDKAAEAVARMENSVVSLEAKKGAHSSKLEELLASMAVNDHMNESSRFAGHICQSIKNTTNLSKVAVKEADFFVLRGAQMPAVLVELEYLSHPISEAKLRSSRFRGHLVKGLLKGILAFDKQLRREQQSQAIQINRSVSKR